MGWKAGGGWIIAILENCHFQQSTLTNGQFSEQWKRDSWIVRITRNVFVFFDVFYKLLWLSVSIESLRGENRWKIRCQAERRTRKPFPLSCCLHQLCFSEAVWVHMHLCLSLFQCMCMCMCCFHVFVSRTVCTSWCHHLFFISSSVHTCTGLPG